MPTLQAADLADLAAMTKPAFGEDRFTQIATTLQDHVAFNTLMRRNRFTFTGGDSIQWNIMHKHSVVSCTVLSCTVVTVRRVTGNACVTVESVTHNAGVTASSVTVPLRVASR